MSEPIHTKSADNLTRRDLLTAKIIKEDLPANNSHPIAQDTIRLSTNAMACEFTIMLNPVPHDQIWQASEILETVHDYESQYTVYRDSSELMQLNLSAGKGPFAVKPDLFDLLKLSIDIAKRSEGTYNPLAHPLILLWRDARLKKSVPSEEEIQEALRLCDIDAVNFDEEKYEIQLLKCGMSFNLGSIGKGYAVDQLANKLIQAGITNFLIHAGQSSVYAAGKHGTYEGWPIGISHPNLANRFLGTILLSDSGMSTSGSGIQFYRVDGKKYGHILDPRTGWPADSTLSAMIFHPSAAMADALSTAAYVACQNQIENLSKTFPKSGNIVLSPTNTHEFEVRSGGLLPEKIYWNS